MSTPGEERNGDLLRRIIWCTDRRKSERGWGQIRWSPSPPSSRESLPTWKNASKVLTLVKHLFWYSLTSVIRLFDANLKKSIFSHQFEIFISGKTKFVIASHFLFSWQCRFDSHFFQKTSMVASIHWFNTNLLKWWNNCFIKVSMTSSSLWIKNAFPTITTLSWSRCAFSR